MKKEDVKDLLVPEVGDEVVYKYKLTYRIPLYMYSNTDEDDNDDPICRNLKDLYDQYGDIEPESLPGIENLRGQCGEDYWVDPYAEYSTTDFSYTTLKLDKTYSSDAEFHHELELKSRGFTGKEVRIEVEYKSGSFYVKCTTELDPNQHITIFPIPNSPVDITLERAIFNRIQGCASDGVGENELGSVIYKGTSHEVWMDWENIKLLNIIKE